MGLEALAKALEDEDKDLRRAVLKAFPEVCDRSDERAINILTSRFKHVYTDVRRAAVRALVAISAKGDAKVIEALKGLLQSGNAELIKTVNSGLDRLGAASEKVAEPKGAWS